ncbi:MAG TPA: YciI family protein [Vicinamibacteria bacterium]|nr:YciI family protein [Vicinamibacteria bacterium]
MKNTFMILWAPGPAWVAGKTVREQPYWAEHAAFMDRLFDDGSVVLGGPFADASGSLVIVEAEVEGEQDVEDMFARDPFVVHGIFALASRKRWLLFLDARRKGRDSRKG